jgi:hypothetical protein
VHFALGILEMEYCKLFAQAGLELYSSQSQSLKLLGLQVPGLPYHFFFSFFFLFGDSGV